MTRERLRARYADDLDEGRLGVLRILHPYVGDDTPVSERVGEAARALDKAGYRPILLTPRRAAMTFFADYQIMYGVKR